jgi:beta-glucanase (GH16 family)
MSRALVCWLALASGCSGCDLEGEAIDAGPGPSANEDFSYTSNWSDDALAGRRMTFQDEFDGQAGALPDGRRWTLQTGGDGWGNQQLEYTTDRASNASLDGQGHLVITARKEAFNGKAYTSARLTTLGHFSQAYGRFEARMQLSTGQGLWPAFWLLGENFGSVGWPACGEIDIVENKGQEPTIVHGTVHGPGYSGGQGVTTKYPVNSRLADAFHIYSIEWSPNRVQFSVDNQLYFEVTPLKLPPGKQWVFDHPFGIILDLAVGGTFVGSPNGSTVFPQTLVVDYVRAYEVAP